MKKPVAILAGLMTILTATVGIADTTKTSSVDKEEVKLQRTESKEGPRGLFEEAQNNLLDHSLNINTNMDQASDKYNSIIDNYPNTDYSKIARFMNISILYSDCSSELSTLSTYIKVLGGLQKSLEKAVHDENTCETVRRFEGRADYDLFEKQVKRKRENIEQLLKSVKQQIAKCGEEISEKGSKLEKSIEKFEEEKGNALFFIEEYDDFCDKLKNRDEGYIQKDPEEKIEIDYRTNEISIKDKDNLKKSYFLQALREIQSVVISQDDFYHISQLLFNIKVGEIFSTIASVENSLKQAAGIDYSGASGYLKKEFAKERFKKALEITDKMELSEVLDIRSNIMSMMEQLEK